MNAETRELTLRVDAARRERVAGQREARLDERPRKRKPKRAAKSILAPTGERFDLGADVPASLTGHPMFGVTVANCCPFSGLSRAELEQHVAGILAMVDEADRRKERAA